MIDVEQLKAQIDCRDLIKRDLGKPKYHNATYSTYKCPLHNEETVRLWIKESMKCSL